MVRVILELRDGDQSRLKHSDQTIRPTQFPLVQPESRMSVGPDVLVLGRLAGVIDVNY